MQRAWQHAILQTRLPPPLRACLPILASNTPNFFLQMSAMNLMARLYSIIPRTLIFVKTIFLFSLWCSYGHFIPCLEGPLSTTRTGQNKQSTQLQLHVATLKRNPQEHPIEFLLQWHESCGGGTNGFRPFVVNLFSLIRNIFLLKDVTFHPEHVANNG